MAYMNKDKKAVIATNIKPILKKYGVKGSLSVGNKSTITLKIKSAPLDFITNYNDTTGSDDARYQNVEGNLNVNPYWFQTQFTGQVLAFLSEAFAALKSAGYYSNTDIMTDYFDDAYYYGIEVGQWDKPFELIK